MDCRTQLASMAIEELDKGDFIMAIKLLTTGIRVEPGNHELYFERSICHHKLGDYQASLDDANTAIRLYPVDFNIHYQKGLALIGLDMINEAVISFKKAIELRAKQEDSKLSDIFKLLRDAINELNVARRRLGLTNSQMRGEAVQLPNISANTVSNLLASAGAQSTNSSPGDSVDSTTDRPQLKTGLSDMPTQHQQPSQVRAQPSIIAAPERTIAIKQHQIDNKTTSSTKSLHSGMQNPSASTSATTTTATITSIPNTTQSNLVAAPQQPTKDDSYSSKYKRLRRDRERARRGTSKICTIKLTDLDVLRKGGCAGSMRVIAPIDGWLYSGELKVDRTSLAIPIDKPAQYVVKLDGDASGSNYLFNQETVLNDVIKEVRVNSVADLRKGARICCYWSRQYKCLSTGVVTSRTFEVTKSLVSVKYDNGDLSAVPLEDLRLLPPDYPKYMSNCDPLLMSRNGDSAQPTTVPVASTTTTTPTTPNHASHQAISAVANMLSPPTAIQKQQQPSNSAVQNNHSQHAIGTNIISNAPNGAITNGANKSHKQKKLYEIEAKPTVAITPVAEPTSRYDDVIIDVDQNYSDTEEQLHNQSSKTTSNSTDDEYSPCERKLVINECEDEDTIEDANITTRRVTSETDEGATIPTTNETINFIASDTSLQTIKIIGNNNDDMNMIKKPVEVVDDQHIMIDDCENPVHISNNDSGLADIDMSGPLTNSGSEPANNDGSDTTVQIADHGNTATFVGVEYRPWMFEGPPKRNKRYGRTYRDNYLAIRRGSDVIRVGDSAELMPKDESILPFVAKIHSFWATSRGEMKVRVRWYYRLYETEGVPYDLEDGENALFETDHFDENDIQSIYRAANILSWTDYQLKHLGHSNKDQVNQPKTFYLAGYYDPVRRIKHLRGDVREGQNC